MSRKKKKHILEEPAADAAISSPGELLNECAEPTTFEIPQASDEAEAIAREEVEAVAAM